MGKALVLVDLVDTYKQAAVGADGIATVTFGPVDPGYFWRVGLINVSSDSALQPRALVYVGGISRTGLRSGTNKGNQNTADQNWPIIVPSTLELFIQWTGATPAATAAAAIQYEVFRAVTDSRPAHVGF